MFRFFLAKIYALAAHVIVTSSSQPCNSILLLPCLMMYQYNGGLLPDITLLTQCYYHRGTRLNAMKRFCICSL